jgi:uncharacterized protein YxjI
MVTGDWFDHNYSIIKDDSLLAKVHRKWISIGDCYEYEIFDSKNAELVLAVIISIDKVIDRQRSS